jgi:hypothetical protein
MKDRSIREYRATRVPAGNSVLLLVVFALSLWMFRPVWSEEAVWSLSADRSHWNELLFLEGLDDRVTASQAARFSYWNDPANGGVVSVGPWYAGDWGARLEYKTIFPSPSGTIRGYYRTEGLLPYQGCVTIAFTKDGNVLAKKKYSLAPASEWRSFEIAVRFPPAGADSFRAAFGLSDQTGGRIDFAKLTIAVGVTDPVFPVKPTAVLRPLPATPFVGSGTFRLERQEDTFWLVTPSGKPFYSIATVGPRNRTDAKIPYRRKPEWPAFLRSLGFNSLAGFTNIDYWTEVNSALEKTGAEPMPLFVVIESNGLPGAFDWLVDARGNRGASGHAFPDPFDPAFEAAYRAKVLSCYNYLAGRNWFVGWIADNELDHSALARCVYSPHCAAAFKEFLLRRYATIGALNQAWQTNYPSVSALIAERPDPILPIGAMAEDFRLFSRQVVARYIDLTIQAIRAVDPDRPIFSNRFMASGIGNSASFLDLYARYDGIAVNLYPQNQCSGLSDNEKAFLQLFHERSGKPLLVTEWSVPALDSGLYNGSPSLLDWSWNEALGNQTDRARQAACLAVDFYNLPFVIGAQWFAWRDFRTGRSANRGLFTADGLPWEELLSRLGASQRGLGSK